MAITRWSKDSIKANPSRGGGAKLWVFIRTTGMMITRLPKIYEEHSLALFAGLRGLLLA
jgi:hypothetical protein